MFFSFIERLCSAGLLPRVSSAVSLDPSDESVESLGRLQMRSNSIPNSTSFDSNIYTNTNSNNNNNNHLNSLKKKLMPSSRRLSVKAEQLPKDSIC